MQIGLYESSWTQTPFVPDEPAIDLRAVTINDDMSTMFPEPRTFDTEVPPAVAEFFSDPTRNWLMLGAVLVVLWTMQK
jgi:hypothetical protein